MNKRWDNIASGDRHYVTQVFSGEVTGNTSPLRSVLSICAFKQFKKEEFLYDSFYY